MIGEETFRFETLLELLRRNKPSIFFSSAPLDDCRLALSMLGLLRCRSIGVARILLPLVCLEWVGILTRNGGGTLAFDCGSGLKVLECWLRGLRGRLWPCNEEDDGLRVTGGRLWKRSCDEGRDWFGEVRPLRGVKGWGISSGRGGSRKGDERPPEDEDTGEKSGAVKLSAGVKGSVGLCILSRRVSMACSRP